MVSKVYLGVCLTPLKSKLYSIYPDWLKNLPLYHLPPMVLQPKIKLWTSLPSPSISLSVGSEELLPLHSQHLSCPTFSLDNLWCSVFHISYKNSFQNLFIFCYMKRIEKIFSKRSMQFIQNTSLFFITWSFILILWSRITGSSMLKAGSYHISY